MYMLHIQQNKIHIISGKWFIWNCLLITLRKLPFVISFFPLLLNHWTILMVVYWSWKYFFKVRKKELQKIIFLVLFSTQYFEVCLHWEMVQLSQLKYVLLHILIFVVRTIKIYFFRDFQGYNTLLLTVATMLHNTSLELISP